MLLGCGCHCGPQFPSESVPPSSESRSSSSEEIIETITGSCPAPRCFNDIAPARYVISIADPGGSTAICQPFYMGSHVVFCGNPSTCFAYLSAEFPKKQSGASCLDHTTGSRFSLNIGGAVFGGNTSFSVQAIYNSSGSNVSIANYFLNAGATDINCVSSFTLAKTSVDSLGFKFPSSITIAPI